MSIRCPVCGMSLQSVVIPAFATLPFICHHCRTSWKWYPATRRVAHPFAEGFGGESVSGRVAKLLTLNFRVADSSWFSKGRAFEFSGQSTG
jgi:hypothetical protein